MRKTTDLAYRMPYSNIQDPGTEPVERHWPSIDLGTEIYMSDNQIAEWTVSKRLYPQMEKKGSCTTEGKSKTEFESCGLVMATGAEDVRFKVLYCGICHNDWGGSNYPLLPGHEVVGVVTEVGSKVQKFKIGDKVGWGAWLEHVTRATTAPTILKITVPKGCLPTMAPTMMEQPRTEFAKALGAKVTVISTSPNKKKEAIEHLGADSFLVSRDPDQMQHCPVETISKFECRMTGRKLVAGSAIGGLKETQEMIDFAAKQNITADIEVMSMDHVNTAMERLEKVDVKYRFVVDVANTLKTA
ncbi:putative cinnamyl alcohol dehydrogenase 6 [Camellia lanceoleosa]|uniref:Cinnamyl alcohol dehydrogenase 6 n=1 Tax=Camellia lanceoleosa TaxID=1840588 RepID=A0ACC0GWS6_9ERIC|nr:putative cinnamyl alcohol dehydrogenase 6 [Camellia lanceoleosa]